MTSHKRNMRRTLQILLAFAVFPLMLVPSCKSLASEGTGHAIRVQINGKQNTEYYLAYHYGNRQYIKDTAYVDAAGEALFSGEDPLTSGLYIIVLDDDSNFEIIVDDGAQHFTALADADDLFGTLRFEGSPGNDTFYAYMQFLSEKNRQRQALERELRDPEVSLGQRTELQEQLEQMDRSVRQRQEEIISARPEALLSRILLGQRDPDLPEPALLPDGRHDTDAMYRKYTGKFFDNIDFTDERLLYTPVYHSRLRIFFNNVLIQHPDSIIPQADRLLEKTRQNMEFFKYTVWFIATNAESSQVMGMDKVFVHMVENYYLTDAVDWISDERKEELRKRAEEIKPLLIGKRAPNFSLQDPAGNDIVLHDIDAEFLIVYFWDSECVFCREAMPKIRDAFDALKDKGVKVYAANIETDKNRWLRALAEYPGEWIHGHDIRKASGFRDDYNIFAIPKVYILDKDKHILARDIGPEHIVPFIRQHITD